MFGKSELSENEKGFKVSKYEVYENGQGVLSIGAFLAAGVAFPFTLAGWGVLPALAGVSSSMFLEVAGVFWLGLVVLLLAKGVWSWGEYRWYYRQAIAQGLYRLADKIARR